MSYEKLPDQTESWLFVIPKPGEESRVFGPTLLHLKKNSIPVSVLCLCSLDEQDLKHERVQELKAACAEFGITEDHVRCVDDPCLPFEEQDWAPEEVARHIQAAVDDWHPTVIVTFNEDSGGYGRLRPFCYQGVARFVSDQSRQEDEGLPVRVLVLDTVCRATYYDPHSAWVYWLEAKLARKRRISHYGSCHFGAFWRAIRKYQIGRRWYTGLQDWSRLYSVMNTLVDVTDKLYSQQASSLEMGKNN